MKQVQFTLILSLSSAQFGADTSSGFTLPPAGTEEDDEKFMNEWYEFDEEKEEEALDCGAGAVWSTEKEKCVVDYEEEFIMPTAQVELVPEPFGSENDKLPQCPTRWEWNGKVKACEPTKEL